MGRYPLKGKVCIVTGASGTGIGYETSLVLSKRGCETVLACRGERCKSAAARLRQTCPSCKAHAFELDVSSASSVSSFAKMVQRKYRGGVDVLVNNAAIARWGLSERHKIHGLDGVMLTNSIGPFLLVRALWTQIAVAARRSGGPGVVLNVASNAHRYGTARCLKRLQVPPTKPVKKEMSFGTLDYGDSKLANIWLTRALAKRVVNKQVVSVAYHPGLVRTELFRSSRVLRGFSAVLPLYRAPAEPAAEIADLVCSVGKGAEVNGKYVARRRIVVPSCMARNDAFVEEFWERAEKVGVWLSQRNL